MIRVCDYRLKIFDSNYVNKDENESIGISKHTLQLIRWSPRVNRFTGSVVNWENADTDRECKNRVQKERKMITQGQGSVF